MIISKTPLRISFFGGGTDYPAWFRENKGAVLSTSIDKYCYLTCRGLPPFFDHRFRVSYSVIELVRRVKEIRHPAVRGCLEHLGIRQGLEIHYDGDLPARTGLGSSSSFTVGLLKCLFALKGKFVGNYQLAREAIRVEQEVIKENVGVQDQMAASLGGFNFMEFGPDNRISVQPFVMSPAQARGLNAHLLLFFTGFVRHASEIAGDLVQNIPSRKSELKATCQLAYEAAKILGSPGKIKDFGKLLHEGWTIKKSLSNRISTPAVDEMYRLARRSGATGGKLLGAGGGGFLLIFAPPESHKRIRQALRSFLHVPFSFENSGSQVVYYRQVEYEGWTTPVSGHRLLRGN
ncbi:MAG: kinase [Elusimicrobia bacterium]|nr:kinase [Elusimicrobiota bacterium]